MEQLRPENTMNGLHDVFSGSNLYSVIHLYTKVIGVYFNTVPNISWSAVLEKFNIDQHANTQLHIDN